MKHRPPEYWIERLQDADDSERYTLLRDWAESPESLAQSGEVARLLAALAGQATGRTQAITDDALAWAIARERVPKAATLNPLQLRAALESLAPSDESLSHRARPATQATLRQLIQPQHETPRRRSWFGVNTSWAAVLATAAVLAGVLWTGPASSDWAQAVGLSRGEALRLDDSTIVRIQNFVADGTTSDAPFNPQPRSERRERADGLSDPPPQALAPLWETVLTNQPTFSWSGGFPLDAAREFEFLLLTAHRRLVWKTRLSEEQLTYPADAPPLEPGQTYHWKINRLDGDQLSASSYSSFRLLSSEEQSELNKELRRSSQPLVRALLLDHWGAYSAARIELEKLGATHPQQPLARKLDVSMQAKQGLR